MTACVTYPEAIETIAEIDDAQQPSLQDRSNRIYRSEEQLDELFAQAPDTPQGDAEPVATDQVKSDTLAVKADLETPIEEPDPLCTSPTDLHPWCSTEELVETLRAGEPPPVQVDCGLTFTGSCDHGGSLMAAVCFDGRLVAGELTQEELSPIVLAAMSRWARCGLTDDSGMKLLTAVSFEITDLDDLHLGFTKDLKVQIDSNAAGHGWFVDPTPH
jgi:hypothetical protein